MWMHGIVRTIRLRYIQTYIYIVGERERVKVIVKGMGYALTQNTNIQRQSTISSKAFLSLSS